MPTPSSLDVPGTGDARTPISLTVILLGPPGCGKGTQARELARMFGLVHISSGDLLRSVMDEDSEFGRSTRSTMEEGKLVSDDVICRMARECIGKADIDRGLVLDGLPRTLEQAAFLCNLLNGSKIVGINLHVAEDVLVRRVLGRMSCARCGEIYNLFFRRPLLDGLCDLCEGTLKRRSDDDEPVLRERLKIYSMQLLPVIEYFRQLKLLKEVSADTDVPHLTAAIHNAIVSAIENCGPSHTSPGVARNTMSLDTNPCC